MKDQIWTNHKKFGEELTVKFFGGNSLTSKPSQYVFTKQMASHISSKAKGCQIWDLERRKYTRFIFDGCRNKHIRLL